MAGSGKVIQVQKIPRNEIKLNPLESLAELCYYYPAYTLKAARQLPIKRVAMMLKVARRLKAAEYFELTQIATAPHTENGEEVKNLLNKYKEIMNGQ